MALNFGTGPILKELRPELRDDRQRHALILEVAERNSVIEGLPSFTEEFRQHLLKRLEEITRETAGRTDGPYSG